MYLEILMRLGMNDRLVFSSFNIMYAYDILFNLYIRVSLY